MKKILKNTSYVLTVAFVIIGMLLIMPGLLSAGGNFDYDPTDKTLDIIAGNCDSFDLDITAPAGNGSFGATVEKSAGGGPNQVPDGWISVSPSALSFDTTATEGDTDTWTITVCVPADAVAGSYTVRLKAHSTTGSPGESSGMVLTVNVTAPTPTTYTVTYDGNANTGGTVPVDSNSYASGATVTVLGNTGSLVKTGYVFSGWNTQADGLGTPYGATFSMPAANTTLWAKWTPEEQTTYTVTYYGNTSTGGAVPVDGSSPYAAGATVTVLGNTGSLVKAGYVFSGWNTQAGGGGTPYAAGATFSMPAANVDLYAQWTATGPKMHTITASAEGNGSITDPGPFGVSEGSGKVYTMTPGDGASIVDVLVDGVSVGVVSSYTFLGINSSHTIHVIFSGGVVTVAGVTEVVEVLGIEEELPYTGFNFIFSLAGILLILAGGILAATIFLPRKKGEIS